MAKVTLSRIYDLSKSLATKAGKELEDPLRYLAEFAELTLRNLRNGLTFADNMDCEIKQITVKNSAETIVSVASRKRAVRITVDQAINQTYYVVTGFGWKYNNAGEIVVKISFDGSPPASLDVPVNIVIHFG